MKPFPTSQWKLLLSTFFGIVIFLFWSILYPNHLLYSEQFQMFLFGYDYFISKIILTGGLSLYVAEFLTQFYIFPIVGAFIITSVLSIMQLIFWRMLKKANTADEYYPLSFIPSISLQVFLCDENSLLSFPIAVVITSLLSLIYLSINRKRIRFISILLLMPFLFWTCGSAYFIFLSIASIHEFYVSFKSSKTFLGLFIATCIIIYGIVFPLLSGLFIQYPLFRIITGLSFYRYTEIMPYSVFFAILFIILLPYISSSLPVIKTKRPVWIICISIVVIIFGALFTNKTYDKENEEIMEYDQLVRNEKWNDIIKKAEIKSPTSPISVTCLNLALGMTGQLGERMFEFYQNGTEGLIGKFTKDFFYNIPTSEVYFHLGMINSSQRLTFESMEAIPDYRKSVRCYKRLVETNLINGQYNVAKKYLCALQKTLFYRNWAEETLKGINNKKIFDSHPEWKRLKEYRNNDDLLFSEQEIDVMLGILYSHNDQNKMALEYMLAYALEQRDIKKFVYYFPLIQHSKYSSIPKSYQEALVYSWTQSHKDFNGIPWSISPIVMNNIAGFAKIYFSGNNVNESLKAYYGNTYWYYLLCKQ